MEHIKAEAASSDVIEVCCAEIDDLLCCTVTLHITDDHLHRKHCHINSSEVNTMDVHTYLCLSLLIVMGVFGDADEVKSVSAMEGHSVTLHTDTQLHGEDKIRLWWSFGPEDIVLAKIYGKDKSIKLSNDAIFQDRVKMNNQTGDLTITHITSQHSGLYTLMIRRNMKVSYKRFSLTVYAGLSVPVISRVSSPCSSSSSSSCCCVLCSVVNVSHDVSVSWYKGKSLLSSISVSDLNIRLSLPLEVEYQDTNTYRCVVNNPITNLTQHLHITQLCHPSSARLPFPVITTVSSDPPTTRVNIIPVVFALVICVIFFIIFIIISVHKHKRKHYKAGLIKTPDGEVHQTDEESSIDSSSTSDGGVF